MNSGVAAAWIVLLAGLAHAQTTPPSIHDPSLVRAADGTYYLFGTHGGLRMYRSTDRVHFTPAGQAFAAVPSWKAAYSARGDLWAPDASFHNGKYWLYYAASSFGKNTSAIGLATSATAAPGSWEDQGMVYSSDAASDYNAIDPALFVDPSSAWWLSFGSFWSGIQMIRIDPATGKQSAGDRTRYPLARRPGSTAVEVPYIVRHGDSYYLFVSFDFCCRGVASTYRIMVGRSSRITGPYADRAGVPMLKGGGTLVLEASTSIIGPGGQSVMQDRDGDLLVYHYYDGRRHGTPTLGLDHLSWDAQGWPHALEPVGETRIR